MLTILKKIKKLNSLQNLYKFLFNLIGTFPKKNVIIFESFLGKQYSCNPRAIYEYISVHIPTYTCYWSYDPRYEEQFKGNNIKLLKRFSFKWLLIMPRAKFWISNSRLPLWIPKPKKTIYVQTWHGTPLKKLGIDIEENHMPGTTTEKYKQNFTKESSRWDYLISPNNYSTNIFKRAFVFNKEIIESGYPRNDFLYNYSKEDIKLILSRLGISKEKKVILYAPTWRDNDYHTVGKYKFTLQLNLEQFKKDLGNDYIILLRLHYLISDKIDLTRFEGFAYDVSTYSDIREIYSISDILITDYSSVFFDYANLNRPILFFVYDIEQYRDNLRGFYFDFENNAPGPLIRSTSELIKEIKKLEEFKEPFQISNEFHEKFTYLEDGHATKRVVEQLFK